MQWRRLKPVGQRTFLVSPYSAARDRVQISGPRRPQVVRLSTPTPAHGLTLATFWLCRRRCFPCLPRLRVRAERVHCDEGLSGTPGGLEKASGSIWENC